MTWRSAAILVGEMRKPIRVGRRRRRPERLIIVEALCSDPDCVLDAVRVAALSGTSPGYGFFSTIASSVIWLRSSAVNVRMPRSWAARLIEGHILLIHISGASDLSNR